MCGIVGILDPSGVRPTEIDRMADVIAHRGPDDATAHIEPGLGFGFRRLAIIDLVTGRQPIPNEDGSVWVMLNGEIYNYRDLRERLVARGHGFRSRSDTEVLAHLYEEHGADLVRELRGMFAFAIWDRRTHTLLLARDHLGQKPLYWAQRGRRFYFASEIKAILAVAPELREVDPLALDEYLTLRIISEPRSMFAGVRKLAAAHTLRVGWDTPVSTQRYWRLQYAPKRPIEERDALAELDDALQETVRAHLVSDVPVGAFLSGGVDSGLVTAMVRGVSDQPLKTFSASVPYGAYDEAPAARRMAERYGTEHHATVIDGDAIGLLPTLVYHLDEPSDPLSACMYQLAALARHDVTVALGGDGGDELFGGYDRYYGMRYVRYYAALPRVLRHQVARRLIERAPDGFWYKSLSHKLRWMDELADVQGGRRYARSLSYFYFTPARRAALYTDRFRACTAEFDAEAALAFWHDDQQASDAVDRMLLADSMVRLPNHSVMILDRMSMAHGLEARSPFLDHRLAELVATLPARLKVHGRQRRYLQLRLAERYIPREVLHRPKQGFSVALPYMMRRHFRILFDHYLLHSHLASAGFLRAPAIRALLEAHLTGRSDHGNRLWLLLNTEIWHRIHIEGVGVQAVQDEMNDLLRIGTRPPAGSAPRPTAPLPARTG